MHHRSITINIDSIKEEDRGDLEAREESSYSKCSAKMNADKKSSNANGHSLSSRSNAAVAALVAALVPKEKEKKKEEKKTENSLSILATKAA